jgi:hypothetical protein
MKVRKTTTKSDSFVASDEHFIGKHIFLPLQKVNKKYGDMAKNFFSGGLHSLLPLYA